MSTISTALFSTASAVGGAFLVAEQGPQDYTAMALLAAVVLGIGGGLVVQAIKQVTATNELVVAVKLLTKQIEDDCRARAAEVAALRDALQRLPEAVTDQLQLREKT